MYVVCGGVYKGRIQMQQEKVRTSCLLFFPPSRFPWSGRCTQQRMPLPFPSLRRSTVRKQTLCVWVYVYLYYETNFLFVSSPLFVYCFSPNGFSAITVPQEPSRNCIAFAILRNQLAHLRKKKKTRIITSSPERETHTHTHDSLSLPHHHHRQCHVRVKVHAAFPLRCVRHGWHAACP